MVVKCVCMYIYICKYIFIYIYIYTGHPQLGYDIWRWRWRRIVTTHWRCPRPPWRRIVTTHSLTTHCPLLNVYIYIHIPGSSKKTAIHLKPQRYLAYPRNPQLQCCDRKCRALSTEMAVFCWRPPSTKFRRQHWIGGRGGTWPLWCGTSWDGCFFWRTRYVQPNLFHGKIQKP